MSTSQTNGWIQGKYYHNGILLFWIKTRQENKDRISLCLHIQKPTLLGRVQYSEHSVPGVETFEQADSFIVKLSSKICFDNISSNSGWFKLTDIELK